MKVVQKTKTINITLSSDMLDFIMEKVKYGIYASPSEVISEAVQLWLMQEEEHETRIASIQARLEQSVNSGEPIPLNKAFEILEHFHKQRGLAFIHETL